MIPLWASFKDRCRQFFKRLDLRFECKHDEESFARWSEPDLLASSQFIYILTASMLTFMAFWQVASTPGVSSADGKSAGITTSIVLVSFIWSMICFVLILVRKRWGLPSSIDWEALLLINHMIIGTGFVLLNRRASAQLFGEDPSEVFQVPDYVLSANPPLCVCVSMAFVGSFAGVRFHKLLFLPLVNCAALLAAYGRAGWLVRGLSTCFLVCAICISILRTSWVSEQHRRSAWRTQEVAKQQAQVLRRQQEEIVEKDQEISEHQDQLFELPGIVPAAPTRQGRAARQGQQGTRRRKAGNADGSLDGRWVVHEPPPWLADWLRRLHIAGPRVIDGDNKACWLDQGVGGRTFFENGELMLDNDMLIRQGRNSRVSYVRMQPEAGEEVEEEEDDDDDRESMADFLAVAVELAAANGEAEPRGLVVGDLHEESILVSCPAVGRHAVGDIKHVPAITIDECLASS